MFQTMVYDALGPDFGIYIYILLIKSLDIDYLFREKNNNQKQTRIN